MANSYTFYSKPEYYKYLAVSIAEAKSGDRIYLATMSFEPNDSGVAKICESLETAAKQGAEVILLIDAYSFLSHHSVKPGPLFWSTNLNRKLPAAYQIKYDFLNRFAKAGGKYRIVNRPDRTFTRPYAGRSHIKYAMINDTVFIGSSNLNNSAKLELMVASKNRGLAKIIERFTKDTAKVGYLNQVLKDDTSYKIDANTTLLLDEGVAGQSLIYNKVLAAIDNAQKNIYLHLPYFPNSTTLAHLKKAHQRDVDVKIEYNHPRNRDTINGVLHTLVKFGAKATTPKVFFVHEGKKESPYLHAKLLVTDKETIIGSHNLVSAGVNFGTAEIAILSKDLVFGKEAMKAFERQLTVYR